MKKSSRQILQVTKIPNSRMMKTKLKAKVFSALKSVKQQIRIPKVFKVSGKTKLYSSYLHSRQLCNSQCVEKLLNLPIFHVKNYRKILSNVTKK